ncbi:hypothetical protein EJ110_NYTH14972 [Nymphaea thermarum]|nr:hypothetical protein EJ110_NYTH14972 [Nymphaea thermarum]
MGIPVLFLLCFLVSVLLRSTLHSLILLFRFLSASVLHWFLPRRQQEGEPTLVLYQGKVWHRREKPIFHAFKYDVRYALLDLDRPPASLALSIRRHHMTSQAARNAAGTDGPVFLLTIPSSVGYEQNPLSVYYCYNYDGSDNSLQLKSCIAEVTNTPWGERVSFVFNPGSDLVSKPLHVSPFMDMLGNWNMYADPPGDNLFLRISVQHPTLGNYFTATLKARKAVDSFFWKQNLEMFFWLMPQKVAIWIYWQAIKLRSKNVSFIHHPKYSNSNYREEPLQRERKLMSCGEIMPMEGICHDASITRDQVFQGSIGSRWCVWRDAKWPWS